MRPRAINSIFFMVLVIVRINGYMILEIPMAPDGLTTVWHSAVELRNGDRYYISNKTQQVVINYNFYVFQNHNLYYYNKRKGTTAFIGNIPTHSPKSLALIPNPNVNNDGVEEGNVLLVLTETCILTFDIFKDPQALQISIEAGHCYESGIRDGLREYSRFNSLGVIGVGRNNVWIASDVVSSSALINTRLCLIHNRIVLTIGKSYLFPPIRAISVSVVDQVEVFVAICWEKGGLSILWIANYSPSLQGLTNDQYKTLVPSPASTTENNIYLFSQLVVNSITLFQKGTEGKRQLYVFKVDSEGNILKDFLQWSENATHYEIQRHSLLETFRGIRKEGLISLYVDFPYGVFVANGFQQEFYRVNTLGCACPPGYALLPDTPHCQLAPPGGYVDVMGNFIACSPGTFGTQESATSRQTCQPCPPFKISKHSQSIACSTCAVAAYNTSAVLLPHNHQRTECVLTADCPRGSFLSTNGSCSACPAGSTSSNGKCAVCPQNTYSNPSSGILECIPCQQGKISIPGSSFCSTVCSKGCAPRGYEECSLVDEANSTRRDLLLSISILGTKAVGAAMAANGTIYIAGFQLLIVIERSGSSINIPLSEFTMVRDVSLSLDESILFAAITGEEILCFTFVGTPRLTWTSKTTILGSAIVGVRPITNERLLIHDAASNRILTIHPVNGWVNIAYSGDSENSIIVSMFSPKDTDDLFIIIQDKINTNQRTTTNQRVVITTILQKGKRVLTFPGMVLNPYMTIWQGRLVLSVQNSIAWLVEKEGTPSLQTLVGLRNISGRVDNIGEVARLTVPGPMLPTSKTLMVVDQTALRMIYPMGDTCHCDEDFYSQNQACIPCPKGLYAMSGATGGCTNCARGQYFDASGRCIPCPKAKWWWDDRDVCPTVIDTMVGRDVSGLSMQDIFMEMSIENPQHSDAMNIMKSYDYVSMHTLEIPLHEESIMQDNAARGRFWIRSKRITPPPLIFISTSPNTPLHTDFLKMTLPGFWIVCSLPVLQTETCSCDLPQGGIKLGSNDDVSQLWNKERKKAASIDYGSLLITLPPDPDLYDGGGIEYIHFMNISVSPTALFVSRTDAGGGTDDDNPSVIFIDSVDRQSQIPIPPPPEPTPSESSFAACVAGWPATYSCPPGFLWVAPLYTCVPCKPGFYHDFDGSGYCVPCPIGSYSELEGSTACAICATVRTVASPTCIVDALNETSQNYNTTTTILSCGSGYEPRGGACMPCIPGFFKSNLTASSSSEPCSPCAAGSYAPSPASTACTRCAFPLVSTQWGGTECIKCATGYVPANGNLDRCKLCASGLQYFAWDPNKNPVCRNKTVLRCNRGYYLKDGGSVADNQCIPCSACNYGEIMTPYDPQPCNYDFTVAIGAPYRCVPVESLAGLFARLTVHPSDIHDFSIQYTPCEGLPRFASWAQGPDPTLCFFKCNYAVSESGARQYAYYYTAEQGSFIMNTMMGAVLLLPPSENLFLLDYPGLSVHLMLLSKEICMPCPKSQCPWGKYRPITDAIDGCGPPTCILSPTSTCQTVAGGTITQYSNDGCIENCSYPENAYISSLALPGTGDSCGWTCKLGSFKTSYIIDRDENETAFTCIPCTRDVCEKGQTFVPSLCLPNSLKESFCLPCPIDPKGNAILAPTDTTTRGLCKYNCKEGSYISASALSSNPKGIPECIACTNASYCPSGFRRVCSAETCVACPNLPSSLWGSAVKMPSNTDTCQAACRSGYHTVDLASGQVIPPKNLATSYSVNSIICALCSLRPSIPCTSSNMCTTGYYMPEPGSGICRPCPTVYDCGTGLVPSSCLCTVCKVKSSDTFFISQREAETVVLSLPVSILSKEVVLDYGTCPAVCKHNTIFMGDSSKAVCTPCDNLLGLAGAAFTAYYSVWNASKAVRWWDASQDPPHLPPRPSLPNTEERRAGLCWPCPPGTLTKNGDSDLCKSLENKQVVIQVAAISDSSDVILTGGAPDTGGGSTNSFSSLFSFFNKQLVRTASSFSTRSKNLNTSSSTKGATLAHGRRRSLLAFSAPSPSENIRVKYTGKRGSQKGILVPKWSKKIVAIHEHHPPFLKTCPPFSLWDNPMTKKACVCIKGFERHSEEELCVPPHHTKRKLIATGLGRKKPSHVKVLVAPSPVSEDKCDSIQQHCSSGIGWYKDSHGFCRLCPLMHIYNTTTGACECLFKSCAPCPDKREYRMLSDDAQCTQCPGKMVALHPFNYYYVSSTAMAPCACPQGMYLVGEDCAQCPPGTYSSFVGNSPCVSCPDGLHTMGEGAKSMTECMRMDDREDLPFIHHEAGEFYVSSERMLQRRLKKGTNA